MNMAQVGILEPTEWSGITGSAGYDVAACPPRAALPQCKTNGKPAERGNILHDYARAGTVFRDKREAFLAEVPEEYRHTAAGMNLDVALDGIRVKACEIAYALDVKERTCRLIGVNIDRKYSEHLAACGEPLLGPYEIPFTIDVEGEVDGGPLDGTPVELDYKSGQSIGLIEEHGQRRISAAGLMFYYGTSSCISRVGYIHDDGEIEHDGHEFSLIDAWETCEYMVEAIHRYWNVREQINRGETPTVYPDRERQCRYCGAFTTCPYWNNLIAAALNEKPPTLTEIAPEDRGRVLDRVKDILKVYTELEDALKEHAKREPLPVDDKYEYSVGTKSGRSYFDDAAARGMIVTLMGRLGASEEEINEKLASFTKKGKSQQEVRRRKRTLPVVRGQAA